MEKVKRYGRIGSMAEALPQLVQAYPEMTVYVLASDFDRVTAEREALQLMLNNRDDLDDQLTTLEQRRYAEQQAREAAERRVEELKGLLHESKEICAGFAKDIAAERRYQELPGWLGDAERHMTYMAAKIEAALNPTAEAESHE